MDLVAYEVHVFPPEATDLTTPQPCCHSEPEKVGILVVLDGLEELGS